jgi:hypothetical protein
MTTGSISSEVSGDTLDSGSFDNQFGHTYCIETNGTLSLLVNEFKDYVFSITRELAQASFPRKAEYFSSSSQGRCSLNFVNNLIMCTFRKI